MLKVRRVRIPLPSLDEQMRIVTTIDEHLSRLDVGINTLDKAARNLKAMRYAVLRAVTDGSITMGRAGEWSRRRLSDVATIASGQTPPGLELMNEGPIPFYKVGDMNSSTGDYMASSRGYVDLDTAGRFRLHVRPAGTVIFPKRGGAISTNKKRILAAPSAYDLNTMGLIPGKEILPRFLHLWISSIDLNVLADGSNIPQINNSDLIDLELSVPPLAEQERATQAADAELSRIDALEYTLRTSRHHGNRLRASILHAAFSGSLAS